MAGSNASAHFRLENRAIRLLFADGALQVENRLSQQSCRFDWPAFALSLKGRIIAGSDFAVVDARQTRDAVAFALLHRETGLEATVRYWLDGEKPWFRKQVSLTGPQGTPTLDRLWVDTQDNPPWPIRRVGYGIRGGVDREEMRGVETYSIQPACGYPVYAGDWFFGLEHPTGFAVPDEGRLELYQHPAWEDGGTIESFAAVFGAAPSHDAVPDAFMDYLWQIRHPRLAKPLTTITAGWSTRYVGNHEYIDSFEGRAAFVEAMLRLGLRPKAVGIDAGWFERASMYHAKGDDERDTRLIAFQRSLKARGLDLAVWVSHNGPVGFDLEWIQRQGWEIGKGPGAAYGYHDYVVMMQPSFEAALAARWERLVGEVGAIHLKMDWDNECASNEKFVAQYPTPDHVREASVKAFNRIDARLRAKNPELATRHGWWPSPWWLKYADHVWLVDSGDCEYEAWPARTARDRDATHRDAMYDHIQRVSETPVPLDAYDNHGFADALCNCFTTEKHTWLHTCLLSALRGTTYIHYPLTPEGLRDWQAEMLQQVLDWWDFHAAELGTKGTRIVLGRPAYGEIYGFLHPHASGAWLMLRNPSVEPQKVALSLPALLGYAPGTVRQVYPCWQDVAAPYEVWLLGHEVRLLQLSREPLAAVSPLPPHEFMVQPQAGQFAYLFPGNRRLTDTIGPAVHPDMQIAELCSEKTADQAIEGGRRLQWFVGVPHRMENTEVLVTLRGPQELLDGIRLRAGTSRYRGDEIRDFTPVTRIFRGERGYGTRRVLPPLGPRDRDDYVFAVPDGGYSGVTIEILGTNAASVQVQAWLTGYEAPARQAMVRQDAPAAGPLLPGHPYGFPRFVVMQ